MEKLRFDELVQGLFATQSKRLMRLAQRWEIPQAMVEDVVQEVWLQLLQHPEVAHQREAPRIQSWMSRVLQGKVVDALRSLRRHPMLSLEDLPRPPLLLPSESLPTEDRQEQLAILLDYLHQENDASASLLEDYFGSPRRAKEVAGRWGLTVPALKCRISRLLDKLRRWASRG